jgi:hypothetical protein
MIEKERQVTKFSDKSFVGAKNTSEGMTNNSPESNIFILRVICCLRA